MSKLIVENRTDMSMSDALIYVSRVIEAGRVSNDGKQYCYHTSFGDGVHVATGLNDRSDRFIVYRDKVTR